MKTTIALIVNFVIMLFILFLPLIVVFLYLRQKALDQRVSRLEQLLLDEHRLPENEPNT